jgi:hypothetical protein
MHSGQAYVPVNPREHPNRQTGQPRLNLHTTDCSDVGCTRGRVAAAETCIKNPRYAISGPFLLIDKSRKASSSTQWGQHLDSGSSIFSITRPLKATVSRAHLHIFYESVVCIARLEMRMFWAMYIFFRVHLKRVSTL